jgi:hypothetical protein
MLSAALLTIPVVSSADILAGNWGVAPGYDASSANIVGNDFVGDDLSQAVGFRASGSGVVSSYTLALSCFVPCSSSPADPLTIALVRDSGGQPGSVVESLTFNAGTLTGFPSNAATVTLNSMTNPLLVSGQSYWLEVSSDLNNTVSWYFNNSSDATNSQDVSIDGGASWAGGLTPSAFQLNGTAVPEPSSIALVLGAGLLFGITRKVRAR